MDVRHARKGEFILFPVISFGKSFSIVSFLGNPNAEPRSPESCNQMLSRTVSSLWKAISTRPPYGMASEGNYLFFQHSAAHKQQKIHWQWLRSHCECKNCQLERQSFTATISHPFNYNLTNLLGYGGHLEFEWSDGHNGHISLDAISRNLTLPPATSTAKEEANSFDKVLAFIGDNVLCEWFDGQLLKIYKSTADALKKQKLFQGGPFAKESLIQTVLNPIDEPIPAIGWHTDFSYCEVPPSVSVLCCESSTLSNGGEYKFIDAQSILNSKIASTLQETFLEYAYFNDEFTTVKSTVDSQGRIRYAPRFAKTVFQRDDHKKAATFYHSMFQLEESMRNTQPISISLAANEALVWNNRRILYSRAQILPQDGEKTLTAFYIA